MISLTIGTLGWLYAGPVGVLSYVPDPDCRADLSRHAACHAGVGGSAADFQLNIWGYLPTSILVLAAINQPFTLSMPQ